MLLLVMYRHDGDSTLDCRVAPLRWRYGMLLAMTSKKAAHNEILQRDEVVFANMFCSD